LKVLQCYDHADNTKQHRKAKGHNLKQAEKEVNHSSHFVALSTDPKFQGIEVFPLISSRGSETLTVGIGVFPLIVILGSFIVFPLVVLLFVMSVLYQVDRVLSSPIWDFLFPDLIRHSVNHFDRQHFSELLDELFLGIVCKLLR
jgi:hypothetical protein